MNRILLIFLFIFSIGTLGAPRQNFHCLELLEEFVGKAEKTFRELTIRIENESVAANNEEILNFISVQPNPFWGSDDFRKDFFIVHRRHPNLAEAFQNAKEQVILLENKIEELSKKFPEHYYHFNPFLKSLRHLVKKSKENFLKSPIDKNTIYSFDEHYELLSSTLITGVIGELAELKVALARNHVIARSSLPFAGRGSHTDKFDPYEKDFNERLEAAATDLVERLTNKKLNLNKLKELYPILGSSITASKYDYEGIVRQLVSRIKTKEFDLITIDKESNKLSVVEVKHSEKIVGTYANTRGSILKQALMTKEIFRLVGLLDEVELEVVFPFGVDHRLARELKKLDFYIDGQVKKTE